MLWRSCDAIDDYTPKDCHQPENNEIMALMRTWYSAIAVVVGMKRPCWCNFADILLQTQRVCWNDTNGTTGLQRLLHENDKIKVLMRLHLRLSIVSQSKLWLESVPESNAIIKANWKDICNHVFTEVTKILWWQLWDFIAALSWMWRLWTCSGNKTMLTTSHKHYVGVVTTRTEVR